MKHKRIRQVSGIFASCVLIAGLMLVGSIHQAEAEALPVAEPAQSAALTGDVERGEQLWFSYYCYSCHGTLGNGGAAPRISNSPRTMEGFIQYVRNPQRMPPYVNRVMSDQQLADVYEWLQTLPASPSVDSIPMLRDLLAER